MKARNLVIFGAILFVALAFSSCERESTEVYHYDIEMKTSNNAALIVVYEYLDSVGCFTGSKVFTADTYKENDNQAKDLFDESAAKIKRTELQARLDEEKAKWYNRNVEFSYVLWRGNNSATKVVVDTKEYSFTIDN
jgi:hypothetical protein